jgi:hypothetical protein
MENCWSRLMMERYDNSKSIEFMKNMKLIAMAATRG